MKKQDSRFSGRRQKKKKREESSHQTLVTGEATLRPTSDSPRREPNFILAGIYIHTHNNKVLNKLCYVYIYNQLR